MFGSRRKGRRAENEIGKMLEKWWGRLEPGCVFKPTPLSGGWSTSKTRGDFGVAGDLCTTAKRFPFVIEVKRRENWSAHNFVCGKRSPVWGWWAQAKTQAAEEKKYPLLFFRKNGESWRVMGEKSKLSCMTLSWTQIDPNTGESIRWMAAEDLLLMDPERFV